MADKKKNRDNRGWHGDPEGHARAGKKGGETTKRKYGPEFYADIGGDGGVKSPGNFKNDPERAREAGRKGGESRGSDRKSRDNRSNRGNN